jgi:hypothetical protein
MAAKFFSAEWCELAKQHVNANAAMMAGFKDPKSFTNKMRFATLDRELSTDWEWKEAVAIDVNPGPKYSDDDLWLIIAANLAGWQEAAAGKTEGGKLLMAGKIKFKKGPMSAAIENGGAFNNFLKAWGEFETDWDV